MACCLCLRALLAALVVIIPSTLHSQTLTATLNGPGIAMTVNSDFAGPNGHGVLLCDVSLAASAGAGWTITSLTFADVGSGNGDTAYSELALFEDSGNGIWDNPTTDTPAASPLPSFASSLARFDMLNAVQASGSTRRFFLTGKLAGTATSGQTFNARLDSGAFVAPAGGMTVGIPTASTTALVIESSALVVQNAPGQPPAQIHPAGAAASYIAAKFRCVAYNSDVPLSGFALSFIGSANAAASLAANNGVSVWLDDGNSLFSAAADSMLFESGGAATVNVGFAGVTVPQSTPRDFWVRVTLTATAGVGAASSLSLAVRITQPTDVLAATTVLLGPPAPQGPVINVVDGRVTTFAPQSDLSAGGQPITITGSGFMPPFSVTIGGVVCPGVPVVTPTQVTGLIVPSGTGANLPIVITSGVLPPITASVTFDYVVGFIVTSFSPLTNMTAAGLSITMQGQGFVHPVSVTIDGVTCPGNAIINAGGTQVSGFYVPRRIGVDMPIVVSVGTYPPQTLTVTFDYFDDENFKVETEGCSLGATTTHWPGAAILVCAALLRRRRRSTLECPA